MEKIQPNVCFDVVFLYINIRMYLFTRFPVFSPFSAHFYPPLHHNNKGSIRIRVLLNLILIPHP